MTTEELVQSVLASLNEQQAAYMLVGSLATAFYEHAGREKDVADARNLIAVQADVVDWPYVEQWCDRHGTRQLLDQLRQECK
jgi:hypothetical protein